MIQVILLLLSLLLLITGLLNANMYILTISLFCIYIFDFTAAWRKRNERGVVLLYLVSFFTFLLGKMLVLTLSGGTWWSVFEYKASIIVVLSIYLALLCLPIGVRISEKYRIGFGKNRHKENNDYNTGSIRTNNSRVMSIRRITYRLFWITIAATGYNVLHRVFFVLRNSYVEAYLSYGGVNIIISRLADVNKIAFFLYLATMPEKEQAKQPILIWLILNGISILSGGRSTIVITFLVLIYYLIYRNNNLGTDESPWLTKRMKRVLIIGAPIAVVFLSAWNYLRNGTKIEMGYFDLILNFLENQGGSYKHIAYAYTYSDRFPQRWYTFGPVINFLRGNIFVSRIIGFRMPSQNTVAMATTGYSFGQAVSYIHEPWNYLAGFGMGSCYLAELYFDFGFIGIALFNIILGMVFSRMSRVYNSNVYGIFFMLLILDSILNLPRNACLAWFTSLTSITLWITLAFITLLIGRNSKS